MAGSDLVSSSFLPSPLHCVCVYVCVCACAEFDGAAGLCASLERVGPDPLSGFVGEARERRERGRGLDPALHAHEGARNQINQKHDDSLQLQLLFRLLLVVVSKELKPTFVSGVMIF